MEETDKSELTKFKRYIQAELELIGCKEISILTIPIKNTGSTDPNEKYIDQNWNDRLCVRVQVPYIFRENEMIPLNSLNIHDTLTVFKEWDDSTAVKLVHRVSGSIAYKTPCDADTARELVVHIFEISKL